LGRWAAKLARAKVILHTVHGWSFNDYQPQIARLFFIWLEKLAAQFTDRLIVVSDSDRQKGLDNKIGEGNKYSLIRYGIDYNEFNTQAQNIRKELGIDAEDLVVGMVACLKPQKCPQDFIKLASLIKPGFPYVKFLLVGDGILRRDIESLINRFNLQARVILTGWRNDISRILSVIDIFVLTSLWEGLPIAVLEAMASGKPVVSTDTPGVEEVIVEGNSGFLVAPHDIRQMAERLAVLLKNTDRA
jgi:glycosyltransferase involved in cell wall biosynthesis